MIRKIFGAAVFVLVLTGQGCTSAPVDDNMDDDHDDGAMEMDMGSGMEMDHSMHAFEISALTEYALESAINDMKNTLVYVDYEEFHFNVEFALKSIQYAEDTATDEGSDDLATELNKLYKTLDTAVKNGGVDSTVSLGDFEAEVSQVLYDLVMYLDHSTVK